MTEIESLHPGITETPPLEFVVLDLEWNQPFTPAHMIHEPVHLVGEIVQIGAVRTDANLQIKEIFSLFVAPKYYKVIHRKVAALTHINESDLENALSFPDAFEAFRSFCGENCVILTWGPDDIPMLKSNLLLHGMDPVCLPKYYDAQRIFDRQITKEGRQFALASAMEKVGVVAEFEAHDALDDAKMTALICQKLDLEKGMAEYVAPAKEQQMPPVYSDVLGGKTFASKRDLLAAAARKVSFCHEGEKTELSIGKWIPHSGNRYIATAKTGSEEAFLVRLRTKKLQNGFWAGSRLFYAMTDELAAFYAEKKEKRREKSAKHLEKTAAKRSSKKPSAKPTDKESTESN